MFRGKLNCFYYLLLTMLRNMFFIEANEEIQFQEVRRLIGKHSTVSETTEKSEKQDCFSNFEVICSVFFFCY